LHKVASKQQIIMILVMKQSAVEDGMSKPKFEGAIRQQAHPSPQTFSRPALGLSLVQTRQ
jgi:hypothetical protein